MKVVGAYCQDMDFAARVGEKLKTARKQRGLSQARLAAAVGVDPRTIVRIEQGEHQPGAFLFGRICAELLVSADDVLQDAE